MAVKSNNRVYNKQKGLVLNRRRNEDVVSDEIALRDEILELKRQVMILKRTNEQNLIKFRKYEDEAKRKDRQIEQLMDPRKNSEMTKILSTKGAAILMNLKDQNNSLVQMILTKDMQIRRLVAEIKTSKLYSASRKTETHRAEVIRLRNLLIKSQEILRENIDLQQRENERSVYENRSGSILNMSPGSADSSPREVEELRFTIQSLETHIKYSNDLLAKKNQQIMNLTEELNTLKRASQRNSLKKVSVEHDSVYNYQSYGYQEWSTSNQWSDSRPETLLKQSASANQSILDLIEKTVIKVDEGSHNVPHSAPPTYIRFSDFNGLAFDEDDLSRNETPPVKPSEISIDVTKTPEEDDRSSVLNGSGRKISDAILPAPPETYTIRKEFNRELKTETFSGRFRSNKRAKEKWKNAVNMCKQYKNQAHNSSNKSISRRKQEVSGTADTRGERGMTNEGENSDFEIHEFEIMEKEIQMNDNLHEIELDGSKRVDHGGRPEQKKNNPMRTRDAGNEMVKLEKNNELLITPEENSRKKLHSSLTGNTESLEKKENNISKTLSSKNDSSLSRSLETLQEPADAEQIKMNGGKIASERPAEMPSELQKVYDNITTFEETEKVKRKSPRNTFFQSQSFDSSFESDNGYPIKRELQVEVEINPVPENCVDRCAGEKWHGESENYDASGDVNNEDDDDDDDDDEVNEDEGPRTEENVKVHKDGYGDCDDDDDDDDDVIVR